MTALDQRLVDAVAAQRFPDWATTNPITQFLAREQITETLTAALAVGWTAPEDPEGDPS